jgi:hypothetical protein
VTHVDVVQLRHDETRHGATLQGDVRRARDALELRDDVEVDRLVAKRLAERARLLLAERRQRTPQAGVSVHPAVDGEDALGMTCERDGAHAPRLAADSGEPAAVAVEPAGESETHRGELGAQRMLVEHPRCERLFEDAAVELVRDRRMHDVAEPLGVEDADRDVAQASRIVRCRTPLESGRVRVGNKNPGRSHVRDACVEERAAALVVGFVDEVAREEHAVEASPKPESSDIAEHGLGPAHMRKHLGRIVDRRDHVAARDEGVRDAPGTATEIEHRCRRRNDFGDVRVLSPERERPVNVDGAAVARDAAQNSNDR